MTNFFVDLHIHIGRSSNNSPVKITASRTLTFENIVKESLENKGLDMVGIIDCMSPNVIFDIKQLMKNGLAYELEKGGICYKNKLCIILGAEIETDEEYGSAHNLCFFPKLKDIEMFSVEMNNYIKNITLSSQRARLNGMKLLDITERFNGILIPAHIFTPHKSYYGNCSNSFKKIFGNEGFNKIFAVELGLSSDTYLADYISELSNKTFLSNSDAHSLPKIAREYNVIKMEECNYEELLKALKNEDGRCVFQNYGLDPRLGKYHRTFCEICGNIINGEHCEKCEKVKITLGVYDRIFQIKDNEESISPKNRPSYIHQVPLEYIPKLGKKTITKLMQKFKTEMNIMHNVSYEQLEEVVGADIAKLILNSRNSNIDFVSGGGGVYGKIK